MGYDAIDRTERRERRKRAEAWRRNVCYVVLAVVLAPLGVLDKFCVYWLVPPVTTVAWAGNLDEFTEHYTFAETEEEDLMKHSRDRIMLAFWNFFFSLHDNLK